MTAVLLLPLTSEPQTVETTLPDVGNVILTLDWNKYQNVWMLDIARQTGEILVSAIPLVAGVDLLKQHKYKRFTGVLIASVDGDDNQDIGYEELGDTAGVYYVVP